MTDLISLAVIGASVILLLVLTLWKRKSPTNLRDIPALIRLYHALGLSIEDGTRLHISLGRGGLLDARGGSALAGLAMLRHIAEQTSVSDKPVIASAGNPAIGLLTQDTLQSGYNAAGVSELYAPSSGRVTGLSPFGYATGAMNISQNENVSANIFIGHLGAEAALLADAADRANVIVIGASDDLVGQSALFASSQDSLIGEELFAVGAYLGAGVSHRASLTLQDLLRWLVIVALLGGAAAKLLGVI
ncbi:MAG: hypothetical protein PHQ36_13135 [Anaerolineales bacterium]|nr:hypothetical protein [Anaerolineales bacterium]